MARFWKEKLDSKKHVNYMQHSAVGGLPAQPSQDTLIDRWVYFVSACSFTFEFHSLEQIRECLLYFSQKVHPSSMQPDIILEHYWQAWEQRLPYWLFEEPKRKRVIKALEEARAKFSE